jgi:hypothetical protein
MGRKEPDFYPIIKKWEGHGCPCQVRVVPEPKHGYFSMSPEFSIILACLRDRTSKHGLLS